LMMECIGDVTATCDVSRLQVDGDLFDSRIQGGVLADGMAGVLAGLCTITPVSVFASVSLTPQAIYQFCGYNAKQGKLVLTFNVDRIMVLLP
jgi:hypothetical protein